MYLFLRTIWTGCIIATLTCNVFVFAKCGEVNNFSENLASVFYNSDPIACSNAFDIFLSYEASTTRHYSNIHSESSYRYYENQNDIRVEKVDNEYTAGKGGNSTLNNNFAEAMEFIKVKFPAVIPRNCPELVPGKYKADPNFYGEPDINICAIIAQRYVSLKQSSENYSTGYIYSNIYNYILCNAVLKPNGIVNLLKTKIYNTCISNTESKKILLYDIMYHNSLMETYKYISSNEDVITKFDEHIPYKPKIIEVSCSDGYNLIEQQQKHWISIVTGADSIPSSSSSSKKMGTYSYVEKHPVVAFRPFKQLIQYSSLVLSSDGYLERNISSFKRGCIKEKNSVVLNGELDKGQIDVIISLDQENMKSLKEIMTDRRIKDFKGYKPDPLPQSDRGLTVN